ncbi:propanediol utilization protein [Escherichia coli]|nr:propanediol utilization protein [Escherichia coli]EKQ5230702.1 propanediol utilization protein [Escherichia coli]
MRNKIREGKVREAGAHNVLVTSAVNNNGVTELFALLHTEEGCC